MGIIVLVLFLGLLVAFKFVKKQQIRLIIKIALLLAGISLLFLLVVSVWMMSADGRVTD